MPCQNEDESCSRKHESPTILAVADLMAEWVRVKNGLKMAQNGNVLI